MYKYALEQRFLREFNFQKTSFSGFCVALMEQLDELKARYDQIKMELGHLRQLCESNTPDIIYWVEEITRLQSQLYLLNSAMIRLLEKELASVKPAAEIKTYPPPRTTCGGPVKHRMARTGQKRALLQGPFDRYGLGDHYRIMVHK
jgi:hypothetical protein